MWEAEGVLQPRLFGYHLAVTEMPDGNPSVGSIEIEGPLTVAGPGDTPSRRRIFVGRPEAAADETVAGDESEEKADEVDDPEETKKDSEG